MKSWVIVFGFVVLIGIPHRATAGFLTAVDIDPSTASFSVSSNGTFGWAFTPTTDITVTDLGFFDRNGDGLAIPHSVGIWDSSQSLLASAIIPSGTLATLQDHFRYVGIAPLKLTALQTYTIAANNPINNGHNEAFATSVSTISVDSSINFNGQRWIQTSRLDDPTFGDSLRFPTLSASRNSYFGPNFQFNHTTVPEPTTLLTMSLSLVVLGCRRRRPQLGS